MAKKGVPNPNFKGFMADSAQASCNAMWIVYGFGGPNDPMVDKEWTCHFH
jgi:hypothetical protein